MYFLKQLFFSIENKMQKRKPPTFEVALKRNVKTLILYLDLSCKLALRRDSIFWPINSLSVICMDY